MRNDFAVFILSHGRADKVMTLKALKKAGYTGAWYILVDNLDDQLDRYIEKYGDHIVVFDKKAWAKKTDTVTSSDDLRSPVFARNAAYEIAEDLGLRFFAEFDDDLQTFTYRYIDNNSLRSKAVWNMDDVLELMLAFQEESGAVSLGFASGGGLIGGLNGKFKQRLLRSIHQAFILRTDDRIEFKGLLNEDGIATEVCNKTGKLAFEIVDVVQNCPARSTNEGGLQELYKSNDEYVRAFYSIIVVPDSLKIMQKNGHTTLLRTTDNAMPKILGERWKKHA